MYIINDDRYGCRTQFDTLREAQDAIRELGPEFADTVLHCGHWTRPDMHENLDPITDQDGQTIGEYIDDTEACRRCAAAHEGTHYLDPAWTEAADKCTWTLLWPVIDGDGILTGEITDGGDGDVWVNANDNAMILATDIPNEALNYVDDGYVYHQIGGGKEA